MNGVLKVPHTLQTAKVVFRHTAIRSVGKAANRSAVHGTKLPIPDIVDVSDTSLLPFFFSSLLLMLIPNPNGILQKEQVEVDINQAREVMEKKRRELENALDSQLKNWNVIRFSN